MYLGAINKITNEYVLPKMANKKDVYICPECNKDLILVQGKIKVHHFRHKVDTNPCRHYNHPSETQIHKDAKMLLKTLLEDKTNNITFIRECMQCKAPKELDLPSVKEHSNIVLEYRFTLNGELKIADVAHVDNKNIEHLKCIYEICHTHKTYNENRPEPWVEINATALLSTTVTPLIIQCVREYICVKCDLKKYTGLNKYIRLKLGQNFEILNYLDLGNYYRHEHKRLSFHENYMENKTICDIFNANCNYKMVIYGYKGRMYGYLITKENYNKYNYWTENVYYGDGHWSDGACEDGRDGELKLPYEYIKEYTGSGSGTVDILEDLITKRNQLNK